MQAHVVSKIIPIRHVYLVLIDTSYENKTKNSSITSDLFNVVDITNKIPNLTIDMDNKLQKYKALIQGDFKNAETRIGHHCLKPHVCEFRDHCWKDLDDRIQNEPNVFSLANGKRNVSYICSIVYHRTKAQVQHTHQVRNKCGISIPITMSFCRVRFPRIMNSRKNSKFKSKQINVVEMMCVFWILGV